jgi:4-hydroxy-4-methyl-2-oxoglutarate aldolase
VALGFPLFARSATPATARGRTIEEAFEVPVRLGDLTVHPGDYVVADRTGIVVVPAGNAAEVVAKAEEMAATEQAMLAALRRGMPVTQVMGRRYEEMVGSAAEDASREGAG